jgi:ABC-type glycerol-3-phosphate transport system substrate-binding protein
MELSFMKKISRLFCIVLAVAMLLSSVACGSSKDNNSTPQTVDTNSTVSSENSSTNDASNSSSQTTSTPQASTSGSWQNILKGIPSNLRGTQIEIFHWNPASELPGGSQVLTKFMQQTGIKVNWKVASYDNYDVELQARVAAGKSPDLVLFQWMNSNRAKLCQPISNVSFDFSSSDWDSELMKYYTVKGKTYAVNMKDTFLNRPAAIFYNKSLIEKYDYEDPYTLWKQGKWTESKFMEMCEDFKRTVNGPAWVVSKYDVWSLLLGLQSEISYKDGKYGNNLRDKRAITAWQRGAEIYHSGLIDRTWDMNGFEAGKYLFFDTSLMYTRTTQPYFSTLKSSGTLGVVPFFKLDGQSEQYQLMSEYEAYGFAKGAKNTTAAAYFLRYYLDRESYNEKTFFFSEQAREVYEYCMKQPNRVMHNRNPLGSGNSTSPISEVRVALQEATSAQVPTILNTYMSVVDACVNDLNNRLNDLQ